MTSGGFFYFIFHTIQELTGLPYWASAIIFFGVLIGMAGIATIGSSVKRESQQ